MKLLYCTECAAPLAQTNKTDYVCQNGHPYYNNPHATVSVVILKDGQALFALRGIEPQKGRYDFPGGFINYGEHPIAAAIREMREEAGITVKALQLVGCTSNTYVENTTTCDFVFATKEWDGNISPDDDVAAFVWKPLNFMNSPDFAWNYDGLYEAISQKGLL